LEPVVNEFKRAFGDICVDLEQTLEAQGRRFVDALLDSEPNRLGAKFRAALYRQTAGHPLFTVELLRDMQGRGDLVRDAEGRWVEGPALDWEILPARVEAAIAERIGRLDEELREALAIASIEGETFTAEVIAQVQAADRRGIGRRLSTDLDRQHRLVRAEEVRMVGTRRMARYRFRHFLFQKYVYSHLDLVERAYLHGDVGNVLEALYGDQAAEIAVQLARHFREAGNAAKAVDYLLQAGNKALRLSAHAEAITHLTNGLTLLRALPDTRERARQELGLQLALGPAFMVTRGYASPEVEQAYTRAVELCRRLDEPGQLVLGLWGLWVYHFVCGRLETAYYHIPL
jgi:predicted ATPase